VKLEPSSKGGNDLQVIYVAFAENGRFMAHVLGAGVVERKAVTFDQRQMTR
jgi:hypothetical protein